MTSELQPWMAFVNTLRPRQDGRHFPDDIFKSIFLNENVWISIKISLKFVPKGPINNIPALVQIMAWRRPGDKPLSEPMMVCSPTHICVTRPQWVKTFLSIWACCYELVIQSDLMFSLICVWINGWVNNRKVGDLRRHRAHYDVTVMWMAIE